MRRFHLSAPVKASAFGTDNHEPVVGLATTSADFPTALICGTVLISWMEESMGDFTWEDPGILEDNELVLVLAERAEADPSRGYVPAYRFQMHVTTEASHMGNIDLRVGDTNQLRMFSGHIAYGVHPEHRGHHYAARSCLLLLPLAKLHGITDLWITCNPDNWASRRTCELAGAQFVEIVNLPEESDMYERGERAKCRYRITL